MISHQVSSPVHCHPSTLGIVFSKSYHTGYRLRCIVIVSSTLGIVSDKSYHSRYRLRRIVIVSSTPSIISDKSYYTRYCLRRIIIVSSTSGIVFGKSYHTGIVSGVSSSYRQLIASLCEDDCVREARIEWK